jgi:adenylosuccinate lyase
MNIEEHVINKQEEEDQNEQIDFIKLLYENQQQQLTQAQRERDILKALTNAAVASLNDLNQLLEKTNSNLKIVNQNLEETNEKLQHKVSLLETINQKLQQQNELLKQNAHEKDSQLSNLKRLNAWLERHIFTLLEKDDELRDIR